MVEAQPTTYFVIMIVIVHKWTLNSCIGVELMYVTLTAPLFTATWLYRVSQSANVCTRMLVLLTTVDAGE